MKTCITTIALFISLLLVGQSKELKKIDSLVNSEIKKEHPGMAVGIIKDGNIIYEKYLGLANLQHQVTFNEKTRSNIASTAKQFTALMVLQLSLEEKLKLDDDIRKYLPKLYPAVKEKIRVRHLLNHTSGIRDYVELLDLEGKVWWQRFGYDNDDIMELMEKQESLGFKPGSMKSYSNTNYNILTKIIEKVAKKSFNDYSKQFFENLGMKETSFVERYMAVIPNRANPYSDWGRGEWWEVPTVTKTNGEGFLFTTLKDQLLYEQAVQNAEHNNNVLLIKSQQPIANSEIKIYGFGLELKDRMNRKAVHHSGGTYGFHSQVYRFPEEKLTVFIMSNNGNISSNLIAQKIARILLPEIKKEDHYDSKLYNYPRISEKSKILGQYRSQGAYLTRIVEEEGKIYFRQRKSLRIELIPEDNNVYHFSNSSKDKIAFYENEMVLFDPSGDRSVFKKIDAAPASYADLEGFVGTYYNSELNISFDLQLTKKKTLEFQLSNEKSKQDVEVFNKNELLAGNNYAISIQRDSFDRVSNVLLTYARAKNIPFVKKTNLQFQPKILTEDGSIQVSTIGSKHKEGSTILLTKNYPNGNEMWYKKFGGKGYDKASSILETNDGYLVIGSTSSYGKGNYDMFVIKTDKKGNKVWQNTYGDFYNEYGYAAEKTDTGYLIKGTIQKCTSNSDVFNRKCTTNVWFVSIDKKGKLLSNKVLEEISTKP